MTDEAKAGVIFGMVRAFEAGRWPKHFSKDDKVTWRRCSKWAYDMLNGGAFNPIHAWKVLQLYDEEMEG